MDDASFATSTPMPTLASSPHCVVHFSSSAVEGGVGHVRYSFFEATVRGGDAGEDDGDDDGVN